MRAWQTSHERKHKITRLKNSLRKAVHLVLDCGGTVSFTESFVYLGSLLHRDLSDHHDVDARIKKASKAFGALRDLLDRALLGFTLVVF